MKTKVKVATELKSDGNGCKWLIQERTRKQEVEIQKPTL